MDDLTNLPNHCASNHCRYCTERRRRRALREWPAAVAKPGDHWERKIGHGIDVLGYWPSGGIPIDTQRGQGVYYLKTTQPKRDYPRRRIYGRR